ncbi:hypothetical protein DFA_10874 [Cavenderia fasciculata]|uniref:NADH dehydrogenase [ubiquinone] 1 alpha subcomplex subunit 1 n=1 Tax=Cavenderia fasciculata TaxID=261658 RepID=F4QBM8_CACFS|nr:uncharacterized protein DFA_10874 [Cavenderia fasciculata]EGG14616.1 hypothetical protein DFA_10874 [Cavenderia fasciculata]|eukprot:XP_004351124.1 hypothetical protein DFA_10874 [Cavenderia fasciculata]
MTWIEVIPVGMIMSAGVLVMAYGLDITHRLAHYGKPHRLVRDHVDYALDKRDSAIHEVRSVRDNNSQDRFAKFLAQKTGRI